MFGFLFELFAQTHYGGTVSYPPPSGWSGYEPCDDAFSNRANEVLRFMPEFKDDVPWGRNAFHFQSHLCVGGSFVGSFEKEWGLYDDHSEEMGCTNPKDIISIASEYESGEKTVLFDANKCLVKVEILIISE